MIFLSEVERAARNALPNILNLALMGLHVKIFIAALRGFSFFRITWTTRPLPGSAALLLP
jgi:hypothetical protein